MLPPRRLRFAVIGAAALLLLAQWITTAELVGRAREAAVAVAADTVQRITRAVEASLNRNLVSGDAILAGLPTLLAALSSDGKMDPRLLNSVLRELNNQNFTFRDVLLVKPDGAPLATGLPISRRRPLPAPLTAAFFGERAQAGAVMIGGPFRNPATGEWALFLARRVTLPQAGPLMAVAEVSVPVISALLSVSGESPGLRISLEREDGTLMASLPHDETLIGHRLPQPTGERVARPDGSEVLFGLSRFDRAPTIMAVRPTLYPSLSITVSLKIEDALEAWYKERSRAYLISSGFAVLVVLIVATLLLALRQRERVEAERSRWRATLENAIDSMTDGFVMWDADDRLLACNSRYKDFYQVSAHLIKPGAHFDDIMREGFRLGQYPQAGEDVEDFLREMRLWHRGENRPMERLLPDGRWVLITERATPGGGTVGIRTDITEIKRTIDDLAAARDAAAAAGEAKSQFLARMSHELRTPLNSILGFAQVLLHDTRIVPEQKEQLQTLHDAARHLLDLVNGLLDLSKITAGRLEIRPSPTELRPLLERCATLMGPEIARKQQCFHLDIAPGTPVAVKADAMRLRQLLLNLLSNAVKFTPPGGAVWLRAAYLPEGRGLRLEVQDNGPGVPPDQEHLLFQDFVQLTETSTSGGDMGPGTGLGLSIAAQLAALMGGSVGHDSPPGGGALFWAELPLPEVDLPWSSMMAARVDAPPAALAKVMLQQPSLRVLVVDDVAANRLVARAMLTGGGHHVTLAEDGEAAVAAVAAGLFDVVLMDLQMPVMDGLEAARRIRSLPPPACAVPVIAVTASVLPEQVEACRAAGMDAHLSKPIDRESLLRMVEELGRGRKSAPAGAEHLPLLDTATYDTLACNLGAAAPTGLREFIQELHRAAETLEGWNAGVGAAEVQAFTHRLLSVSRTMGTLRMTWALEALAVSLEQGCFNEKQQQVCAVLRETLPEVRRRVQATPLAEMEGGALP